MKIILISLPQKVSVDKFETIEITPLAIYLLAAVLKESQHDISVIDPCEFLQFEGKENVDRLCIHYVEKIIEKEKVESIAFSVNTFNWSNSKIMVDAIAEKFSNIKIILGGLHVTIFDKHVLEVSKAHIVIRGEGEKSIVNLYNAIQNNIDISQIKGITYKNNDIIQRNPDEETLDIVEMSNTPYPCYELLPENNPYTQLPVETSRGCYFNCVFCSIPHRKNWRGLSESEVINRTKHALKFRKNIIAGTHILYVDDCFTANGDRAINIFKKLNQLYGSSQKFFIEARITDILKTNILQSIPPEMISSMQIGVECGYNEGLKKIHKGLTIEQLFEALKIIKKYKFERHCFLSFIIGFPWENMTSLHKTLDTIGRISSEFQVVCNLNWLLLLPSDLWNERKNYNIDVEEDEYDKILWYGNRQYFFKTHPLISTEDILVVEERVRKMRLKGPVGYRRSIGLEEDYIEPSSIYH